MEMPCGEKRSGQLSFLLLPIRYTKTQGGPGLRKFLHSLDLDSSDLTFDLILLRDCESGSNL